MDSAPKLPGAPRFRKVKKSLKSPNSPALQNLHHKNKSQKNLHHNNRTGQHRGKGDSASIAQTWRELFLSRRLKALLVDIFMIYTPIVYIAYIMLGSAQDFRQNQPVIFICFLLYACICAIFIAKSGQTPGLRYAQLRLVRTPKSHNLKSTPRESNTPESNALDSGAESIKSSAKSSAHTERADMRVGFWRAFVRVFVWAFSCAVVVGFVAPFALRSRQCLHDLWLGTRIIEASSAQAIAQNLAPSKQAG